MNKYTSFEFSKKLWDNGCSLKTDKFYPPQITEKNIKEQGYKIFSSELYPKYDILWDICVKYAKEFFGEESTWVDNRYETGDIYAKKYLPISENIFYMFHHNKSQEEIEKYIWDNCLFNTENKKELK